MYNHLNRVLLASHGMAFGIIFVCWSLFLPVTIAAARLKSRCRINSFIFILFKDKGNSTFSVVRIACTESKTEFLGLSNVVL